MKIHTGAEGKWRSQNGESAHWFHGKVVRLLGDIAVVDDKSGLSKRCVAVSRLEHRGGYRRRFAGGAA